MWLLKKSLNKTSSRTQIKIKEVRDGILILPNNNYRQVIKTSSINFELKSESEQDILIDNFQNFLNSLPTKIQILIRIREVDLNQYVENVKQIKLTEKKQVYKNQIDDYCQFISNLVSGNKILSRKFYIIIPYKSEVKTKDFDIIKKQLNLTSNLVIKSLEKLGMKAEPLTSIEILNLFYTFYNQNQTKTQKITNETIKALVEENYV